MKDRERGDMRCECDEYLLAIQCKDNTIVSMLLSIDNASEGILAIPITKINHLWSTLN